MRKYEYTVFGSNQLAFEIAQKAKKNQAYGRKVSKIMSKFNRRVNDILSAVDGSLMSYSNGRYMLDLLRDNEEALLYGKDFLDNRSLEVIKGLMRQKVKKAFKLINLWNKITNGHQIKLDERRQSVDNQTHNLKHYDELSQSQLDELSLSHLIELSQLNNKFLTQLEDSWISAE